MATERPRLHAELTRQDGVLATLAAGQWPAVCRVDTGKFAEAPLTVGAIFDDLVEGVDELRAAAKRYNARLHVRVHEAHEENVDPLGHLRASVPENGGS